MERIEELFVFVTENEDEGGEGVVTLTIGRDHFPFFTADRNLLEKLRPVVQQASRQGDKKIHLLRFTTRELLETITPQGTQNGLRT